MNNAVKQFLPARVNLSRKASAVGKMVAYYDLTNEMANRPVNSANSANIQLFWIYIEEACGNRAYDKCRGIIRRLESCPSKTV
jgi:hypothetical protein